MPITKQEEYNNTVFALNLIKDYEYEAKAVQYREKLDDPRAFEESTLNYDLGTTGYIASSGYKSLLQAYNILYNDNSPEINTAIHALNSMYAQTFIVNNIANMRDDNEHRENVIKKYTTQISKNLFKDLEQNNYCILGNNLIGGKHFTVIKFSKENNKYYYTLYNSGAELYEENDKVLESTKQKAKEIKEQIGAISQDKEIEPSIKKQQLTRLTKEYLSSLSQQDEINKNLYSTIRYEILSPALGKAILYATVRHNLENEVFKSKDKREAIQQEELQNKNHYLKNPKIINIGKTFGQKFSNCPTRSTREFLRDALPQFKNIYDFVVQNSVEDITSMLEIKKTILEYELDVSEQDIVNNQRYDTDNQYSIIQQEINKRLHRPTDDKVNFLYIDKTSLLGAKYDKSTELAEQNAKHLVNTDVLYSQQGELCVDLGIVQQFSSTDGLNTRTKKNLFDNIVLQYVDKKIEERADRVELRNFYASVLTNLFPLKDTTLPITKDLLNPITEDLENHLQQYKIIQKKEDGTNTVDKSLCNPVMEKQMTDDLLRKSINNTDIHPILLAQLQAKIINLSSEKNKISGHEEDNGYVYAHRLLPQIETQRRVNKELETVLLDTANIAQAQTMVEKVLAKRQNAIVKR